MGALDLLFIAGGVLGLAVFVVLWRRLPRQRVRLVIGALVLAGAAVFAAWWVLFRVDDPRFAEDRERALETQKGLDDALGF